MKSKIREIITGDFELNSTVVIDYNRIHFDTNYYHKKWSVEFNHKFEYMIKNNLKKLGFEFCSRHDFYVFLAKKTRTITNRDNTKQIPEVEHYTYLDFVDDNNKGVFIGGYIEYVKYIYKDNMATGTIEFKFIESL